MRTGPQPDSTATQTPFRPAASRSGASEAFAFVRYTPAVRPSIQPRSASLWIGFGLGLVSVSPSKNHLPSSET